MDIRLETLPFDFDGRHYILRCNYNVLADVQLAYDGDLSPALSGRGTMRSVLEFLAAMLNDYADEQGWFEPGTTPAGYPCAPELSKRFTARQLGRKLRREEIPAGQIMSMVFGAITPKRVTEDEKNKEPEETPGN